MLGGLLPSLHKILYLTLSKQNILKNLVHFFKEQKILFIETFYRLLVQKKYFFRDLLQTFYWKKQVFIDLLQTFYCKKIIL